jgi:cytochrome c
LLSHATTLWDYINRAMPFPNSKTLTPNEVYAVTAYVLNLNEILPADATLDEKSLPLVKMPNNSGFTTNHGMMSVKGKPDVRAVACMKDCTKDVALTSSLPAAFVRETYGDLSGEFRGLATMSQFKPGNGVQIAGAVEGNAAGATSPKPQAIAQQNACTACHSADKKIVGPAFRDVAAKYKDDKMAMEKLSAKLRAGGSGNWGATPMPPQAQLSDSDLKTVLTWVLAGAPAE